MPADEVGYEPVSVKAVLAETKDTAELLIDLSYSAVLLGSDEVAAEVEYVESRQVFRRDPKAGPIPLQASAKF